MMPDRWKGTVDRRVSARRRERPWWQPDIRFPERRSGFDRRRMNVRPPLDAAVHVVQGKDGTVGKLIMIFAFLSVLDYTLTILEIRAGLATEGNGIMNRFMAMGFFAGLTYKLSLTALVAWAFWSFRRYYLVLVALVGAVMIYGTLTAYHLGMNAWVLTH